MEVAAGVVLAEQAISTTIEGAVLGAIALAKPTHPLKVHFTRFATTPDEEPVELLHVSSHSISVINGRAYVFGGQLADGRCAGDEFHIFDLGTDKGATYSYKCIPAVPAKGEATPPARFSHTANAVGLRIYVFGGHNDDAVISDDGVWSFDAETMKWDLITAKGFKRAPNRYDHASAPYGDKIIIHGGRSDSQTVLTDTWIFDTVNDTWSQMPDLKTFTPNTGSTIAVADDLLYVIDHTEKDEVVLHSLDLKSELSIWQTLTFAQEVPHPPRRRGSSLLTLDAGMGRKYLVYMFGEVVNSDSSRDLEFCSDIWTYQLPASPKSAAAIKDATNETLGFKSDRSTWAEIVFEPEETVAGSIGKVHPGPRADFAVTTIDSRKVVLWGGLAGNGINEGDGWFIELK